MDSNKGVNSNQFNWGKMLNEDLDTMHKTKIDMHMEEIMHKKLQDQIKRKTL